MFARGDFRNTFSFTNNHKNNELRTAQKPECVFFFFKKNQFLGCSCEFLKFVSVIYFLLINTSLIEKESAPTYGNFRCIFSSPYYCNFDHSFEEKHEKSFTF